MGYQTNISISNDFFGWIQKNPKKFVRAIAAGMNHGTESLCRGGRFGQEHRTEEEREAARNNVVIHKAEHADTAQVIFTYQNAAYQISDVVWAIYQHDYLAEHPHMAQYFEQYAKQIHQQANELENALEGRKPWEDR